MSPPFRADGPVPQKRRQAFFKEKPWTGRALPGQSGPMRDPRRAKGPVGRGKKKMRSLGSVQILTEAFLAVLKLDE